MTKRNGKGGAWTAGLIVWHVWASALVVLLSGANAEAQLRVVSYNVADWGTNPTYTTRSTHFKRVFDFIGREEINGVSRNADIIAVQESRPDSSTLSQIAADMNAITGTTDYVAWAEQPFAQSEVEGFVYNVTTVSLDVEDWLRFGSRSVGRVKFRPVGYSDEAAVWVYNTHYEAGSNLGDIRERRDQAFQIRLNGGNGSKAGGGDSGVPFGSDHLPGSANIIYAGDYNQKNSYEDAGDYDFLENPYEIMKLGPGESTSFGDGEGVDPINRPGYWYSNSSFADIHTQSPHDGSFGLTGGGMDDRFDFQMISTELNDGEGLHYIGPNSGDNPAADESYHTFGNNGTSYNQAANVSWNTALDWIIASGETLPGMTPTQTRDAVRDALAKASDHSPVVVDYALPAKMAVTVGNVPTYVLQGRTAEVEVSVENSAPVSVALGADELDYAGSGSGDVTGAFSGTDAALGGGNDYTLTLSTAAVGDRSGSIDVTASSYAAADAYFTQALSYTVVLLGDVDADGDQAVDEIDAADIDALFAGIDNPGGIPAGMDDLYDIDGDGGLDGDDVDELILSVIGTHYGDSDLDGVVDDSDLDALRLNWEAAGTGWAGGDFNGDGIVNIGDLGILAGNWGLVGAGPTGATVPEPASLTLLAVAAMAWPGHRRRS